MNDTPVHDPHHDDAEAERLLAEYGRAVAALRALQDLPPSDDKIEKAERARDERVARGEMERIDKELARIPYGPPGPLPRPEPLAVHLPLLAGPPSWRTGFRDAADDLVAAATREALEALVTNKRAEGPRITALQVLDHHLARGEPPPPPALDLLGRVLHLDPKSITAAKRRAMIREADEAGRTTKSIAAELGISERAVRLLRQPVEQSDAMTFYLAVDFAAERGQPPRRGTRDAIARLLGLLDAKGTYRRAVIEDTHDGLRQPGKVRDAAEAEARRRAAGKSHNDAKAIARAMKADARDVAGWMRYEGWEMAVVSEGFWLRPRKRNHRAD